MKLIIESAPISHEDLFIERYAKLSIWALQMTGNDRELAEDLVQDAFIQFTFTRPDIARVHNLEAYLYGLMRNLHLSQVRRSTRARLQPVSIVEYESAEMSLRAADARDQIKAQDELRQICHYACARKESAWVGSVLILRFFHGYYPSEIAQVLRTTRASVDERLRLARSETRASLTSPATLGFMKDNSTIPFGQTGFAREVNEFLSELRQMIFQSRQGRCFSHRHLQTIYSANDTTAMKSQELAHIVSCPSCMDLVNKILDLPLLAERYPTDTIGRDQRGKGGKGGGSDGGSGGGASIGAIKRWRRRAREAFEHRPKELHISVNGLLQGSQKINSELSEQTLNVDTTDRIGFVEVFSELGIRLLLLNVDEPPPHGQLEQATRIELSDQRTLELKLRFDSPWPTLHVAYADPLMRPEGAVRSREETDGEKGRQGDAETRGLGETSLRPGIPKSLGLRSAASRAQPLSRLATWSFWLRPATVTALIAVAMVAGLLFTRPPGPAKPISVAELLQRSVQQEEALVARTGQVLHRTINLEERDCGSRIADCGFSSTASLTTGNLISRHRIEIWHSAEEGITARRVYDDRGTLIAGDWLKADGVQTVYHHGSQPGRQIRNPQSAIRSSEIWQLDPSAKDFASLIAASETATFEEQADSYRINYEGGVGNARGLVRATLVLSRADLHATEQILIIQKGDDFREYRFLEASFERRAPSTVAPRVFEPEQELLGNDAERGRRGDTETVPVSPSLRVPASRLAATPELELEVLRQLDQAGAFYGEQLTLSRTPDDQLVVQGIVDSAKRKAEIRQALASFLKNPALRFEVETAEEAQEREARRARSANESSASVSSVEVQQERATPADADLRAYFSGKGLSGAQLEQEVRRFSDRALDHSRQARRHALALKQIVERFSLEDLRRMDESSRQQWQAMIGQHARNIQQETEALRRDLQPIFFPDGSRGSSGLGNTSDVAQTAKQLFEIAVSNDDFVRRSFTLGSSGPPAVKSSQFVRSLESAFSLATAIAK